MGCQKIEQCYKGRTLIITQVVVKTLMSFLLHFHHVAGNQPLSREQAHQAMSLLLDGHASEPQIAGFLVALKMRGETADELTGFAQAMRDHMIAIDAGPGLVDTCGTGGDQSGTFQYFHRRRDCDGRSRSQGRQARQPFAGLAKRQRRCAGSLGRSHFHGA